MSNNLIFIKNGGIYDNHCGEITYYSPIIYLENNELQIDNTIKISCVNYGNPSEHIIKLNKTIKYLIYNDNYGYTYNDTEIIFSNLMSDVTTQQLQNLAFTRCIFQK